jgi:hypothetical protein
MHMPDRGNGLIELALIVLKPGVMGEVDVVML